MDFRWGSREYLLKRETGRRAIDGVASYKGNLEALRRPVRRVRFAHSHRSGCEPSGSRKCWAQPGIATRIAGTWRFLLRRLDEGILRAHRSRRDRMKVARRFTGGIRSQPSLESPSGTAVQISDIQSSLTGLGCKRRFFPPLKWRATFGSSLRDEMAALCKIRFCLLTLCDPLPARS